LAVGALVAAVVGAVAEVAVVVLGTIVPVGMLGAVGTVGAMGAIGVVGDVGTASVNLLGSTTLILVVEIKLPLIYSTLSIPNDICSPLVVVNPPRISSSTESSIGTASPPG
jgi:hypothetical protein